MNVYEEDPNIIFLVQNKDPFFAYLTRTLFAEIDFSPSRSLLDLGCGSGRNCFLAVQRGLKVLGIDSSPVAIDLANRFAKENKWDDRLKFEVHDLTALRNGSVGQFDYCILSEVVEHVEDYQAIIDFAKSSLKAGGKLLLTTPNDPSQWNRMDVHANHIRRFTLEEIKKALSGFENVKVYTVGFPFHRLIIGLYDFLLSLKKSRHKPQMFRANRLVLNLYYVIGTLVMAIDNLFRFTRLGTTIVAIATKSK